MGIPGWQAHFSEYRSAIYYVGGVIPGGTGVRGVRLRRCFGVWTSVSSDYRNCGMCGHQCGILEVCCSNQCEVISSRHCGHQCDECAPDQECCLLKNQPSKPPHAFHANWVCTTMGTNSNCGGCGMACEGDKICVPDPSIGSPYPLDNYSCVCPPGWNERAGVCCPPGRTACDGVCVLDSEYPCRLIDQDCCAGVFPSGCMPKNYHCCGDHPCQPNSECCGPGCMNVGWHCCWGGPPNGPWIKDPRLENPALQVSPTVKSLVG